MKGREDNNGRHATSKKLNSKNSTVKKTNLLLLSCPWLWIRLESTKVQGEKSMNNSHTTNSVELQVVYSTLERLWNLVKETFAPVWSLSTLFILTNSVIKSLQKIRFENIQNRRPHGSLIKHGCFWDFWMCKASVDDQSPDIPFRTRWILGNSIRPV